VIKALGIENVADDELETICRELLEQNPQIVTDYQGGKKQAIGSLIGQAKKKNPNANPGRVRELLIQIIENT
jgi:aspartyl-tRNA(Asn)/glutamyl-tRNA(Gln) amidotransferase subunit B